MNKNNDELARRIYRFKTISKYNQKAKLLGYKDSETMVFCFLYTRLTISIVLFTYLFFISSWNIFSTFLVTVFFYNFFSYYKFDYQIKKRANKLEKDAIYFFEVLTLSIDSGKNLLQSMELTTSSIDSDLSREFAITLREIKYGKSFYTAFTDLRKRMPSDVIQNAILNITDAYTSGSDITNILRKQIDFIQNKRVMDIKAKINQIPIKVSVVSVFLFIPLVLLLVLAPIILEYFVR